MDLDRLLGKRFDLHLVEGPRLDVRIVAVDPERDLAAVRILRTPARLCNVGGHWNKRRQRGEGGPFKLVRFQARQMVVLTDLLKGIRQGVLVESCRP